MQLVSVNVGSAETITHGKRTITTGICKRPVTGPVDVTESGVHGDQIVDGRHHGGVDQAVYAYSADDYAWWANQTGHEYPAGLFGENLTIKGLPSDMVIGDRLLIGDVVLEATSARIPCGTLATRMADTGFGTRFRQAERPGIYFRVLNAGQVQSGDSVTMLEGGDGATTVLDLFRFAYETRHDAARLQRFLDAPIAERVRAQVESALEQLAAGRTNMP